MSHPDKQTAVERQPAALPGRDSAPTGAPSSANARMGEEGSPAAPVQARNAGVPALPASAGTDVLLQVVTGLLPALVVRLVPLPGTSWFSIDLNREGLFFFLRPVEVALVFPWVKF